MKLIGTSSQNKYEKTIEISVNRIDVINAIDINAPDDYKNHRAFIFLAAVQGCLYRKYGKEMHLAGFN